MHRLANTLLAILPTASALLCPPLATAQHAANPWPTRGWPVSPPEEQGMSAERLAHLVDFGARNDMDSVRVTRHGRIVLESYAPFRAGLKHRVYSVTKSVSSAPWSAWRWPMACSTAQTARSWISSPDAPSPILTMPGRRSRSSSCST